MNENSSSGTKTTRSTTSGSARKKSTTKVANTVAGVKDGNTADKTTVLRTTTTKRRLAQRKLDMGYKPEEYKSDLSRLTKMGIRASRASRKTGANSADHFKGGFSV